MTDETRKIYRFGEFVVDLATGEIYRNDVRIELQSKGFALLEALLKNHGQVMSRQDLAESLWPGIHVQVDQGLNSAVRKVRRALGDDAQHPTYLQTVGSFGYKFIHPVEEVRDDRPSVTGPRDATKARDVTRTPDATRTED